MKIIDCRQHAKSPGKAAGLGRALGNISVPFSQQTLRAQDKVVQVLQRILDNRFNCLREVHLAQVEQTIPFILVGPTGVWIVQVSEAKGVFRAFEDKWEELDTRSKKYRPGKPNILTETVRLAQIARADLLVAGISEIPLEPVVFFADPGAHIDTTRPATRIVLLDALERFGMSLLNAPPALEPQIVEKIVDCLCGSAALPKANSKLMEEHDVFSLRELQENQPVKSPRQGKPVVHEPGFVKKLQFSRRQWFLLVFLLFLTIIILVALVLVVLILS